jgi:hypothetical protein
MSDFQGYHSEWNLGSPGGWGYQRSIQRIGKRVWEALDRVFPSSVNLDFDHPLLYPHRGFIDILLLAHRTREGRNPGLVAVVAEEETLESVTENRDLARWIDEIEGMTGVLAGPREFEMRGDRVCHRGRPVSVIFMDFNTDVLLSIHRKHDVEPLLQAVREGRVVNPRGTEPINVKSTFEIITGEEASRFHREIAGRTPWTRRFFSRRTTGPDGRPIADLLGWTAAHWEGLVLKPERGYSGRGVRVGSIHDAGEAIDLALTEGGYVVQEKIPLGLWSIDIPVLDREGERVSIETCQTDFRCLIGPRGLIGFLGRYGGVPTNVGSGGGVQPLAVVRTDTDVGDAARRLNEAVATAGYDAVREAAELQEKLSREHGLIYLLGPIKMALRPRLITEGQIHALERYAEALWADCVLLEQMWLSGGLDGYVHLEAEELDIVRSQPWRGAPAVIASDGLFNFGDRTHDDKG